jgi:hypothetical protein
MNILVDWLSGSGCLDTAPDSGAAAATSTAAHCLLLLLLLVFVAQTAHCELEFASLFGR